MTLGVYFLGAAAGPRAKGLALGLVLATSACMTPAKERQMRNDIFSLQTRVMQLEGTVTESKQETQTTGEVAKKKLATTSTELERMQQELQRIRGDIDALKIGVSTGQMPGAEASEASLAGQIRDLQERMQTIETQQLDIIAALEKGGKRPSAKAKDKAAKERAAKDSAPKDQAAADKGDAKPKETKEERAESDKKDRSSLSTVSDLQEAFAKKRFKHIVQDGPKILKTVKGSDKEEASFLYAESLFKLGKLRESALQYNDFLENKPSPKYQPLAKMRMGDSFRHMGDTATAKIYYEELVSKYPQSPEAEKAKERLAELSAGGSTPAPKTGENHGTAVQSKSPLKKVAHSGSPKKR